MRRVKFSITFIMLLLVTSVSASQNIKLNIENRLDRVISVFVMGLYGLDSSPTGDSHDVLAGAQNQFSFSTVNNSSGKAPIIVLTIDDDYNPDWPGLSYLINVFYNYNTSSTELVPTFELVTHHTEKNQPVIHFNETTGTITVGQS